MALVDNGINSRIDIVLATYNGIKYIKPQLNSIKNQMLCADEVLIFDDDSNDGTQEFIDFFIHDNRLLNWCLYRNSKNLGWRANFLHAINKSSSDIVFLADQDDIWMSDKISLMMNEMNKHPEINVLACNVEPFFENDTLRNISAIYSKKKYKRKRLEKVVFDNQWNITKRPGCSMCFRKSFIDLINCVWFPDLSHDGCIWSIAVAQGSAYILNEVLVKFRRHASNSTPSNEKSKDNRLKLIEIEIRKLFNILECSKNIGIDDVKILAIKNQLSFLQKRKKAIQEKNIGLYIKLLFSLGLYAKPSSWLADLYVNFRVR